MPISTTPGIFAVDVPTTRLDTYDGVMDYFYGRPCSAFTRAEAWSWWRGLHWQDYAEDRETMARNGAKIALTAIICHSALIEFGLWGKNPGTMFPARSWRRIWTE